LGVLGVSHFVHDSKLARNMLILITNMPIQLKFVGTVCWLLWPDGGGASSSPFSPEREQEPDDIASSEHEQ